MSDNNDDYFEYLTKRSLHGYLYRKFVFHPRIIRYIEGRCLDVGCGIGDFVKHCPNSQGVEINDKLVDFCVARGLEVTLSEPDQIPFGDSMFDSVLLDNVLEHLEDPSQLLGEIVRVMKSSGRFIVGVPGVKGYASDPDHKTFYDEEKLKATICEYGFICEKVLHIPFPGLSNTLNSFCYFGVFRATS